MDQSANDQWLTLCDKGEIFKDYKSLDDQKVHSLLQITLLTSHTKEM